MIEQKTVYTVNGKTFENEADAVKENDLVAGNEYTRIANKFLELINVINNHSEINSKSELCSVYIDVKDKELLPEFFVTKTYSNVLRMFLKKLDVNFLSYEGDERNNGYLKIETSNLIKEVPTVQDIMNFIPESIKQIEEDFEAYLKSIR